MNRDEIISLLRRFKEMNRDKYNIIRIGLFGSVARENMGGKSDIDIVVQLKTQDLFDLIGIKLDLEEELHQRVDIVSYREKMNEFLKRRIDKEAVYV
ncbi:MAG: nucleotidyltransferase domain-containing protein [Deltaproteobacteria bacterium]|nr:nucleotidyltransferase domain-containing protein [Deltaproteobacteria bacterium]MBW2152010.1 nucleotidyltransferase domain-containing protein [Deltaproteobacteria bacterium]